MRRTFRYGADGLCLAACAAYVVDRWVLAGGLSAALAPGHLRDVLLLPAALPWLLALYRRAGWRRHDRPPGRGEIALHWAVWSCAAEVAGPVLFPWTVGDPWDVAAYAAGGVVAGLWWRR